MRRRRAGGLLRVWLRRILAPQRARQRGFSLIEILVTVALLGTVIAAGFTSMMTATKVSDITAQRAEAESLARRLGELARSRATPYATCSGPGTLMSDYTTKLNAATGMLPTGYAFAVTKVEYGSAQPAPSPPTWSDGDCAGATPPFERITIAVTSAGPETMTTTAVVVKRDPAFG